LSFYSGFAGLISLLLIYINVYLIIVTVTSFVIYFSSQEKHKSRLAEWESTYTYPVEPLLRHFHDPLAELTNYDRAILKVFNNWPGYPPFWEFLRQFVIKRDKNKCQVSGCPSRVDLQVHHKSPVSQGGEHAPANLVTLCRFHHGLEPYEGHERIWGDIKTRYFTMVQSHKRKNPSSSGYHFVRAHVRRLELVNKNDLSEIYNYYAFSCPYCDIRSLKTTIYYRKQQIKIRCKQCSKEWVGPRGLAEETGPRLAEILGVKRNKGIWKARWDMLETRSDSTFRLLKEDKQQPRKPRTVSRSKKSTAPKCPKCGSPMLFIKPQKGQRWKAFWGCTKYKVTGCKGSLEV